MYPYIVCVFKAAISIFIYLHNIMYPYFHPISLIYFFIKLHVMSSYIFCDILFNENGIYIYTYTICI
jgi:hypothetical protein